MASYPLLSQAPTQVEVELGCDNYVDLEMSNGFNLSLNNQFSNRTKRNIFDIFTPYTINDLGATANNNYRLVNRNFENVHITEEKLSHAQKQLHEQYSSLNTKEMSLFRKELYLELRTLKSTFYSSFIFDLQEILTTNSLDKTYVIVFELLRSVEYCFEFFPSLKITKFKSPWKP